MKAQLVTVIKFVPAPIECPTTPPADEFPAYACDPNPTVTVKVQFSMVRLDTFFIEPTASPDSANTVKLKVVVSVILVRDTEDWL